MKKRNIPVVIEKQAVEGNIEVELKRNSSISQNKNVLSQLEKSYQYTGQLDDIDRRDMDDPLCATAYVNELYDHFRMKEEETSAKPTYMEAQPNISARMRTILIDWLIEVHLKFKLIPETLYLTVNVIDRYLERATITRQNLQLLGVTALFLASKYEEIYPPEISDLIYICDNAYDKEQILFMEESILKVLHYNMTIPSPHAFLVRFLKAAHADRQMVLFSCYILDGTLQSYKLLSYRPSQLAAAAVMIARKVVGRNTWSPTLRKYAAYDEEEILPIAREILQEKSAMSEDFHGVDKKYSSSRYGGIAKTPIEISL